MGDSNNSKQISLVKFDRPELVIGRSDKKGIRSSFQNDYRSGGGVCGVDEGFDEALLERCKESITSQIETDQILDSIAPPREWEEDGKRFRQLISRVSSTRSDILDLNDNLNEQLTNRQARPDGICPIRRELADQAFDELIRQITISQPERGLLLIRIRDELRMTLLAYQDLFVSSRDNDPFKTVLKESFENQTEVEAKLDTLTETVKKMQSERDSMLKILECEDQVFKEQKEASYKKHSEEFQFLKRVNNVLKQHIEAMLDPNNNLDPVITAFESHPKAKTGRERKGRRDPCKK